MSPLSSLLRRAWASTFSASAVVNIGLCNLSAEIGGTVAKNARRLGITVRFKLWP